jgi:hypothetical protein
VLAIVTAMTTAAVQSGIKPIEAYLMLMICFGYFFTVLYLHWCPRPLVAPKRVGEVSASFQTSQRNVECETRAF